MGALTGSFGASDEALLDILFGRVAATGTLPFEPPSSMDAVVASREDVPNDTEAPLYPYGHGLRFWLLFDRRLSWRRTRPNPRKTSSVRSLAKGV